MSEYKEPYDKLVEVLEVARKYNANEVTISIRFGEKEGSCYLTTTFTNILDARDFEVKVHKMGLLTIYANLDKRIVSIGI